MNADELAVCMYLKGFPGQYVSGKEICRRAGGKGRAREEPRWAIPVLIGLAEQRIVESDATGHFRLIQPEPDKSKQKKWVSPQVYRLLKASGKTFDEVFEIDTPLENIPSLGRPDSKGLKRGNTEEREQGRHRAGTQSEPGGSTGVRGDQSPEV